MIHISLPAEALHRRLPFYLAVEEWVATRMPEGEYFFTWAVQPTVICGRNQDIAAEVNLDYCRAHDIDVVRRRSGGGAVYADPDNLMISYITPATEVATTFSRYTGMIAGMLRAMGLKAEATGRNDVLIDGRKVSGNAFYHLPQRSIVHGTMLVGADMGSLLSALTPSEAKLSTHGVKSVRSRVTTIGEHLPGFTIADMARHVEQWLSTEAYELTATDIAEVEKLEAAYYEPAWLFPELKRRHHTRMAQAHEPGVGQIKAIVQLDGGKIQGLDLLGDFFLLSDLDSTLLPALQGVEFTPEAMRQALEGIDVGDVIAGLTNEKFIEIINS